MAKVKVSLISTVLNEEKTIESFLDSLARQTKMPDEIIIVDGGSKDKTVPSIKYRVSSIKKIKFKLLTKRGNRSVGRNEAIKRSTGSIIAVSDAGCILDKNWLENIVEPFKENSIDVVAGYYKAKAASVFEKSLIPYVLVMPDRVDVDNFLPASRSMALRKTIWEKAGKFDEKLSHNEDYAFAKKLKRINANIAFEGKAIVHWIPRKNIWQAFTMFYRFAYGDAEAGILRPKVISIYVRYMIGVAWGVWAFWDKNNGALFGLIVLVFLYGGWAIWKNYKYVKDQKAFFYLPLLQITSDIAVILGTSYGLLKRFVIK